MVSAGVALLVVFNLLVVATGLAIAVYLVAGRPSGAAGRNAGGVPADWYVEAASLATDVRDVAAQTEGITVGDRDAISRRLLPLSTRLRSHARAAPAGVDDDLVEQLHALGRRCNKVGMEYPTGRDVRTGVFPEERLQDLDESAASLLKDLPLEAYGSGRCSKTPRAR